MGSCLGFVQPGSCQKLGGALRPSLESREQLSEEGGPGQVHRGSHGQHQKPKEEQTC